MRVCFVLQFRQIEDVWQLVPVEKVELLIQLLFFVGGYKVGVSEIFKFNIKVFPNIDIFWRKIIVDYGTISQVLQRTDCLSQQAQNSYD